jgi:hypothetical protein
MKVLDFGELAQRLLDRTCQHPVRLIAVDGPAGSGKSTFAASLSATLGGAPIVPMDDFGSFDDIVGYWPRFEAQVLAPLFRREPAHYQQRDWTGDWLGTGLGAWRDLPFSETLLLEGLGAARRAVASRLSFAIWIDAPPDLRLKRGIARDGDTALVRDAWQRSMLLQQRFFEQDGTRERADLVVDGTRRVDGEPSRFVVLREGRVP